jgi:hypothetical protein
LDAVPVERQRIYYKERWCLFPKVVGSIKHVLEVVPTIFITPLPFNLHKPPFFHGCVG